MPLLDNEAVQKMRAEQSSAQDIKEIRRQMAYKYGRELYDRTFALFVETIDEFLALAQQNGLPVQALPEPKRVEVSCTKEQYRQLPGLTSKAKGWYWFSKLHWEQEAALKDGRAAMPLVFVGSDLDRTLQKSREKKRKEEDKNMNPHQRMALHSFHAGSYLLVDRVHVSVRRTFHKNFLNHSWLNPEAYFSETFKSDQSQILFPVALEAGVLLQYGRGSLTKFNWQSPPALWELERDLVEQAEACFEASKQALKHICEAALAGRPLRDWGDFAKKIQIDLNFFAS